MAPASPSSPAAGDLNPWDAYLQIAFSLAYPTPSPGFRVRILLLLASIFCVSLAAIAYLTLTLVDYRRRGRTIWLWRFVDRQSGRLIVGNQQPLQPLLTLNSSAVFAAFVITEYRVFVLHADQRWTDSWRVVPWMAVFVQNWIVSCASLQAFIISLGDHDSGGRRWCRSTFVNAVFLVGDIAQAGVLLAFVIKSAIAGRATWDEYVVYMQSMQKAAEEWSITTPVDEVITSQIFELEARLAAGSLASFHSAYEAIGVFVISSILISLVSFGGIALVVAVRRQIKISSGNLDNFRTFGSMIVTLPSRRPSTPEDLDIYASGDPSGGVKELSASLPPAVPAFPTNPTAILITTSLPPRCDPASQLRREPTRTSVRPMSRAVVRELAMQSDIEGGARKEHAKNLMALQRAEADLFVTSLSVLLIMVPVGIIMVWGATVLQRLPEMPFFASEATLFLDTWFYSAISGLALWIHCWTSWVHLPVVGGPPGSAGSGSEGASRGREEEDRLAEDSFEGMLRGGPDGGRRDAERAGGNPGRGGAESGMATAVESAPWPAEDKGRAEKGEEKGRKRDKEKVDMSGII